MRPWVSDLPREYREWLGGVESAWTVLEPGFAEKLMGEPPFEGGALHLAVDLTADELGRSVLVQNALVLLGAAAEGDGLKLTARKNLTRATVGAMRDAMVWPGCAFEEQWRAGKVLSEDHMQELRLLRALVEMDGLVKHAGGRLRTTAYGHAVLKGRRSRLQANLFRNAFWQMSLNLFGGGECGHWPQQQIGTALWALSTTGHRWQETSDLMRLSVLPDDAVLRNPDWVAPMLFALRVLRPLLWFGLLECREDPVFRDKGVWRKTALFDRLLTFDTKLPRTDGKAIYGHGNEVGERWARKRREELDEGRVEEVLAALRSFSATCEEARRNVEYFSTNRERMNYPKFRAMGLCVATGVVEGGCKHIVATRLKRGGMRWTVAGTNAIIALRCAVESNRFDDFWERRAAAQS